MPRNLDKMERMEILILYRLGRNVSQIAEELKMARATVRRWIKRHKNEGTLENRCRKPKQRVLTENQVQHLVNTFKQDASACTQYFADLYDCSLATIRRALKRNKVNIANQIPSKRKRKAKKATTRSSKRSGHCHGTDSSSTMQLIVPTIPSQDIDMSVKTETSIHGDVKVIIQEKMNGQVKDVDAEIVLNNGICMPTSGKSEDVEIKKEIEKNGIEEEPVEKDSEVTNENEIEHNEVEKENGELIEGEVKKENEEETVENNIEVEKENGEEPSDSEKSNDNIVEPANGTQIENNLDNVTECGNSNVLNGPETLLEKNELSDSDKELHNTAIDESIVTDKISLDVEINNENIVNDNEAISKDNSSDVFTNSTNNKQIDVSSYLSQNGCTNDISVDSESRENDKKSGDLTQEKNTFSSNNVDNIPISSINTLAEKEDSQETILNNTEEPVPVEKKNEATVSLPSPNSEKCDSNENNGVSLNAFNNEEDCIIGDKIIQNETTNHSTNTSNPETIDLDAVEEMDTDEVHVAHSEPANSEKNVTQENSSTNANNILEKSDEVDLTGNDKIEIINLDNDTEMVCITGSPKGSEGAGNLTIPNEVTENHATEDSATICDDIANRNSEIIPATEMEVNNVVADKKTTEIQEKFDISGEDEDEILNSNKETVSESKTKQKTLPVVCKLSNNLDILSDEEEQDSSKNVVDVPKKDTENKNCINIEEDDDVMVVEDTNSKEDNPKRDISTALEPQSNDNIDMETGEVHTTDITDLMPKTNDKDTESCSEVKPQSPEINAPESVSSPPQPETKPEKTQKKPPLLPKNFLKTAKKNLAEMTRHELEDFCILRIVESIVDRSNLSEIKTKMKTMALRLDEFKKRALSMAKQNRDLQVVLKSVQEDLKNRSNGTTQPPKITRSVGMQVLMTEKMDNRRKMPIQTQPPNAARPVRSPQLAKQLSKPQTPPNIPVPRKVPVTPSKPATNTPAPVTRSSPAPAQTLKTPPPAQKVPEKRTHSRMQSSPSPSPSPSSVTVDLTDDEPPAKVSNKAATPPVRVVPSQNLMAQNRQFNNAPLNSPRKVYIPISGPQGLRPGQPGAPRNMATPGPRNRLPTPRAQAPLRPKHIPRHPAPLPEAMKQYTPPTWKALPPAPDLKLSKVENGIVISWKIDGYPDNACETIASYQLYAYQETSAPPSTSLWKKIGDVKALPLPMACTLTQFMTGFKYYFAVRAVDVRSRLGPFSLPGSILLLNKV